MKKTKPPILSAKDLSNIRVIFLNECLPLNRQQEKKIKTLEKENALLKRANEVQRLTLQAYAKSQIDRNAPVFKFLLGEQGLRGAYFGDPVPSGQNCDAHWWRKYLREALGLTLDLTRD